MNHMVGVLIYFGIYLFADKYRGRRGLLWIISLGLIDQVVFMFVYTGGYQFLMWELFSGTATFLILLTVDDKRGIGPSSKVCEHCAETIKAEAVLCKHCGQKCSSRFTWERCMEIY